MTNPTTVNPREPGASARPPVRQKLYCEALPGAADPVTAGSREWYASTQEGGRRRFPANPAHSRALLTRFCLDIALWLPSGGWRPQSVASTRRAYSDTLVLMQEQV